MDRSLIALLAVQIAAFWPVWRWLAGRVAGDGEAAGMLVALLAALALPSGGSHARRDRSLVPAAVLTLAYAASFHAAPPLGRAVLALAALAATWNAARREDSAARWGLFLLAAPVVPTLQFYGGYPLRLIVTHLAAAWLRLSGLGVSVDGLGLAWRDRVVLVDAPCSGVRMIWGTLLVCLATAVLRGFGSRRTLLLVTAGLAATVLANSLRAASLFFTESGLLAVPAAHGGVGVLAFAATSIAVVAAARWIGASA